MLGALGLTHVRKGLAEQELGELEFPFLLLHVTIHLTLSKVYTEHTTLQELSEVLRFQL